MLGILSSNRPQIEGVGKTTQISSCLCHFTVRNGWEKICNTSTTKKNRKPFLPSSTRFSYKQKICCLPARCTLHYLLGIFWFLNSQQRGFHDKDSVQGIKVLISTSQASQSFMFFVLKSIGLHRGRTDIIINSRLKNKRSRKNIIKEACVNRNLSCLNSTQRTYCCYQR